MNKTGKVVIFGIGDFAEVVASYLTNDSAYEVVAFTVNHQYISDTVLGKLPIIPFEQIQVHFPPKDYEMFIAVGYSSVNKNRAQIYQLAKTSGYRLISYINSKAMNFGNVELGENTFIFENVVIQPFAKIGNNVTIWSSSLIAHHSTVGDHCFIAHNVAISGHVTIEPYCFVGANATIRDRVKVAARCVIGAGAVILEDTTEGAVYKGMNTEPTSYTSDQLHRI
jgi:sugar O-acyltransferase (sialic acid O-acetyltransferase NeuD family)